ncbi:hypothetical protein [Thalassospira xiamenensis]|uniref:hypothetical protein n=1 Tax=Thalassospira xiamenensis TaxID=220697 RepID=UPI00241E4433|nr:hypothetical protein [Thalassospira xiamenensis]
MQEGQHIGGFELPEPDGAGQIDRGGQYHQQSCRDDQDVFRDQKPAKTGEKLSLASELALPDMPDDPDQKQGGKDQAKNNMEQQNNFAGIPVKPGEKFQI